MSDLHSALDSVTDPITLIVEEQTHVRQPQGPSLFERTIGRMKAGIDELEKADIILRRLHHDA